MMMAEQTLCPGETWTEPFLSTLQLRNTQYEAWRGVVYQPRLSCLLASQAQMNKSIMDFCCLLHIFKYKTDLKKKKVLKCTFLEMSFVMSQRAVGGGGWRVRQSISVEQECKYCLHHYMNMSVTGHFLLVILQWLVVVWMVEGRSSRWRGGGSFSHGVTEHFITACF